MEILNILYSNNLIAVYLIGAILVVILIFIVISSMSTTPKDKKDILKDPTEEDNKPDIKEVNEAIETVEFKEIPEIKPDIKEDSKEEYKEIPRINDIVENLYQKSLDTEEPKEEETKDLNTLLEEFEVPESVIEEVVNEEEIKETQIIEEPNIIPEISQTEEKEEIETPRLKEPQENIEDMLKRLYDLRQSENESRRKAMINEIYDLKKQVDETLKSNINLSQIDYSYVDTQALADYYLFNEDIEFPKLK